MDTDSTDYLAEKVLHSRRIEEAVALESLFREGHSFLSDTTGQPHWGVDKPLCQHCWRDISGEDGFCPLCRAVASRFETSPTRTDTGILVSCQNAKSLMSEGSLDPEAVIVRISDTELLVLLPTFEVASFLTDLRESISPTFDLTNIVFPGNGELTFGDAIALARYAAGGTFNQRHLFLTKFFFNHAHMRAFDFDDYLPFDITRRLLDVAADLKSMFADRDRSIVCEILKKDRVNRIYELNRFYSMCHQDQKALLNSIQIENTNPDKALLLLKLVRYVP